MKAAVTTKAGAPELIEIQERPVPGKKLVGIGTRTGVRP
jgi:hypothetical protein